MPAARVASAMRDSFGRAKREMAVAQPTGWPEGVQCRHLWNPKRLLLCPAQTKS